jgi:hypothetical protein
MTSESTRFLGQPNEIKPTVGAVGGDGLVTFLLYRGMRIVVGSLRLDGMKWSVGPLREYA